MSDEPRPFELEPEKDEPAAEAPSRRKPAAPAPARNLDAEMEQRRSASEGAEADERTVAERRWSFTASTRLPENKPLYSPLRFCHR